MVGTEDYNQAKFAFRYVDTDAKSFRIETANYEKLPGVTEAVRKDEGYVKWMNGVVVVVDNKVIRQLTMKFLHLKFLYLLLMVLSSLRVPQART